MVSADYTHVNNAEALDGLLAALRAARRVGLDTEADSLHHYFEKVCLIQISFFGSNFVIDPLAGFSLAELFPELAGKDLVLQGADYDLRMLGKSFGFRPRGAVFDTMLAAQVLGYERIGLAALVERFCGVTLSKSGQKHDWSRRPLAAAQLRYAADDTRYLETVADRMAEELCEKGRQSWHRECCERVVAASGERKEDDGREAWRIKGTSKLDPRTLAFVREIWKWRDAEARRRDRPPFMILKDEDLVELSCRHTGKVPGAPHAAPAYMKRIAGAERERLDHALRAAAHLKPGEWPVLPKRTRFTQDDPRLREKTDALRAACKTIAEGLRIDPGFLASRAALAAVARHAPRTVEALMEAAGLMRWQAELVLPAARSVI